MSYEQIKTGGFLPALIAALPTIASILGGLGGVGGLAGGAAAIEIAVKTSQHQNAEKKRRKDNLEMEKK